jgi:membrane protein YdbS with pleckstrin-like domain
MKRRNAAGDRRRRKSCTVLWTAVLAIGVMTLLYYEMSAVLYILATLGVTALLVVVAASDLHYAEKFAGGSARIDDSAAIGSGITPVLDK